MNMQRNVSIARSDQEVLDFVRTNPGAVGYVSASAATGGVKVLTIQ
jgi:ABC-type phosphate transport system substrate-binding protein